MKFDDVANAVKAQLYDRASSPLLGSFVLAWLVCNYRLVAVLFSSTDLNAKFTIIDTIIFPSTEPIVVRGLLLPLVVSALFIFAYPYPARWVLGFYRRQQKLNKELQQRIEDETPLTLEEARELRRKAISQQLEFDRMLREKDSQITEFRGILQEVVTVQKVSLDRLRAGPLLGQSTPPPSPEPATGSGQGDQAIADSHVVSVAGRLNSVAIDALNVIGTLDGANKAELLGPLESTERIRREAAIDSLLDLGLIGSEIVRNRAGYRTTPLGRAVLLYLLDR